MYKFSYIQEKNEQKCTGQKKKTGVECQTVDDIATSLKNIVDAGMQKPETVPLIVVKC